MGDGANWFFGGGFRFGWMGRGKRRWGADGRTQEAGGWEGI